MNPVANTTVTAPATASAEVETAKRAVVSVGTTRDEVMALARMATQIADRLDVIEAQVFELSKVAHQRAGLRHPALG